MTNFFLGASALCLCLALLAWALRGCVLTIDLSVEPVRRRRHRREPPLSNPSRPAPPWRAEAGSLLPPKAVILLAVLLWPALLAAQTHPCDKPAATTQKVVGPGPYRVAFCHPGTAPTVPTPTTVDGWLVFFDGIEIADVVGLIPIGPPSLTGLRYFETPTLGVLPKGTHVLTVKGYLVTFAGTRDIGAVSPPFTSDAVDSVPPIASSIRGIKR